MKMPKSILEFREKLEKDSRQGLALDIDETLSWTVGYWMEEMSKRFGNPENLSVKELVKKYRYTQHVPHWQTDEGKAWIEEARHLDSLQENLPLIENADKIVQKVDAIVPILVYVTTRPDSVVNGTKKWLQKHNFPLAEVIARPLDIPVADGNSWKTQVLRYLYPEIIGIIDDNAELVSFLEDNYLGKIYLYDNNDHPKKGANIIPCSTWDDVLAKVEATMQ